MIVERALLQQLLPSRKKNRLPGSREDHQDRRNADAAATKFVQFAD
jgi:hypothetical protein